jgi:ATP-dependent Clp protease ATP-binding subunit ClpA
MPEHIAFTPQAKKVVELAVREALLLDHNFVGTEHPLLGVLAEEGVGAKVLVALGLHKDRAEKWILNQLIEIHQAAARPLNAEARQRQDSPEGCAGLFLIPPFQEPQEQLLT